MQFGERQASAATITVSAERVSLPAQDGFSLSVLDIQPFSVGLAHRAFQSTRWWEVWAEVTSWPVASVIKVTQNEYLLSTNHCSGISAYVDSLISTRTLL